MKKKGWVGFLLAVTIAFSGFAGAAPQQGGGGGGENGNAVSSVAGGTSGGAPSAPVAAGTRKVLNFNDNWKFIFQDDADAKKPEYDEAAAGAKDVSLPHNRDNYDLFTVDAAALAKIETVNWYRRHFSLDKADKDKRVFVEFNGGGQINKVYVNGLFVGEARGEFTHFKFDITDYVAFGRYDNVIAVQADSRFHPEMPPGVEIDFHLFGGLHGSAAMTIADRAYADSVFYYNEAVQYGDASATVRGQAAVANTYASAHSFTVKSELLNRNGAVVSAKSATAYLEGGGQRTVDFAHTVGNPVLWDLTDPYLYTARTTVSLGALPLDRDERQIGIRTFTAGSPLAVGSTFKLNGKPVKVFGANSHMQAPYLGNSLTKKLNVKDARTLKYELGMDMVRLSHYQQDPAFLDECDRIGLLVEEEALSWNDLPDFEGQFAYSVLEMVKRDRNHASIVMWSIFGNENPVLNGPSLPVRRQLNAAVKELDPSRLTAQEEINTNSVSAADVYGVHDYGQPDQLWSPNNGATRSWIASEWNNNTGQNFQIPGDSELRKLKQLLNYARKMETFNQSDSVMGALIWNSNGYLTRNGTYDKGKVLDSYRSGGILGPMRDASDKRWIGYLYQAQRSQAEVGQVLYICSEWKRDSAGMTGVQKSAADDEHPLFPNAKSPETAPPANAVYVASNFDTVKLYYADGASKTLVGALSSPNRNRGMIRGLYEFTVNQAWTPTSRLVAEGYNGGEASPSGTYTRYASEIGVDKAAASLQLRNTIGRLQADGSDVAWVIAELLDKNGQRAYYGEENVTVEKTGGKGEVFFGGDSVRMNDGLAGFYVRSATDKPGTVTARVGVDIGESFDDGAPCFNYDANWNVADSVADAFGGGYRRSAAAGATATVGFDGTQIALYGEHRQTFGSAAVSIDGGAETTVSFKCNKKYGVIGNQRVYLSPALSPGAHTVTIRALTSEPVAIDRVKVFDGADDLSQTIAVSVDPWTEARVSVPAVGTPLAKNPGTARAVIQSVLTEAEGVDAARYTVGSGLRLKDAAGAAREALADGNAAREALQGAADGLRAAFEGLIPKASDRIEHTARGAEGELNKVYFFGVWSGEGDGDGVYSPRPSRTDRDYYSVTFTGTGVSIYSRMADAYGYAYISVDGGGETQTDFYRNVGNTPQAVDCAYTVSDLPYGKHTVKVRAGTAAHPAPGVGVGVVAFAYALVEDAAVQAQIAAEKAKVNLLNQAEFAEGLDRSLIPDESLGAFDGLCADAARVLRDEGATLAQVNGVYNDLKDLLFALGFSALSKTAEVNHKNSATAVEGALNKVYYWSATGTCWTVQGDSASKDLYTYSAGGRRTAGDYYSIAFEGRQIEIYTIRKSNHGMAAVYIDGEFVENVDFWKDLPDSGDTAEISLAYQSPLLADGAHTVKVVFLNQTSGHATTNCLVSFSYAYIYN